jgi:hypothetical protein
MQFASPKAKQNYPHLTVLGIALAALLLGMFITRSYAATAYTLGFNAGKAKAESEFNVKRLLANKDIVSQACFAWWFSDQHRLSKKP